MIFTGRKEDVASAKKEILSAADHFSQIRACRKNNINGSMAPGPPANVPGQKTINVTVPYRVVGLVVGPKGATIKRIQQTTQTYIVTPSRDKEPIFEVTGMPDNVETAKREIESHIAMRTGNVFDDDQHSQGLALNNQLGFTSMENSFSYMNRSNLSSLNALLSSNGLPTQNPGSLNGHYSGVYNALAAAGATNDQSSLSTGLTNTGGLNGPLNNASLSALTQLLASSGNNGSHAISSDLGGMNTLTNSSNGLLNNAASNYTNGSLNGVGGQSSFGTIGNVFNDVSSVSNFNLLGEQANNILNLKNSGLESSSSAHILSSMGTSNLPSANSGLAYGIDEGLGSLGSSMGSSPALDQGSQNIWSDTKFQTPLSSYNFNGPSFGGSSDATSRHMSPSHTFSHGSVQRSNSDPTPQVDAFASALSLINPGGRGLHRSGSSSPEGLHNYELPSLSLMPGFSRTSPVLSRPLGDQVTTSTPASSSLFDFKSSCVSSPSSMFNTLTDSSSVMTSVQLPLSTTTAASAVPIGTPASSSQEVKLSATESRRGSLKGDEICPTCKGESSDVAFVPCGHRSSCLPCAKKLQESTGSCPSCQSKCHDVLLIRSE